jgi:hypothetical protein
MKRHRTRHDAPGGRDGHAVSSLPRLQFVDWCFIGVLVEFYQNPDEFFVGGRPSKGESWIGPVFLAFRRFGEKLLISTPSDHLESWIQEMWPRFLNWHHMIVGAGFRDAMLSDPRIAAVHANLDALCRQGVLPHTPVEGLAQRIRAESRRKGTPIDRNLTDRDALNALYALDDTRGLTTKKGGRWTLNVQLLYDRLRNQGNRETPLGKLPTHQVDDSDPAEAAATADEVRALRDVLDRFRAEGPVEAAAVDYLISGDSRRAVAARHNITEHRLRGAEERLERQLDHFRRRLTG